MAYPDPDSRSAHLYQRARRSLPDGATRGLVLIRPHPIYVHSGQGAWVTDVDGRRLFPHASQIVRIYRERCTLDDQVISTETAYYLTSLPPNLAGPQHLDQLARGHWGIENRVHYVRDVTYDEDRSQAWTGNGPRTLATCRNLAISALRVAGHTNIAKAIRHIARNPTRALTILGL